MWFDSHCHLDAPEFINDLQEVVNRAKTNAVDGVLIPAVQVEDFDKVINLCHEQSKTLTQTVYALGIHPLYINQAKESDLQQLDAALEKNINDPRLVAVGEIGLDYFVKEIDNAKQEYFFEEQLKLAKKYNLPVILHVRRAQDQILKRLRIAKLSGGIAHAFNGSFIQAEEFLKLNFKLGIGGAMTYERALQIRRLATDLSLDSFVLETDAPDIPPAWLVQDENSNSRRNEPYELKRIAQQFATLRQISDEQLALQMRQNLSQVLPRWAQFISPSC
jgi:TatD DNase family protein